VHGVLDVVVGLQGRGDVGRIRGLDLRDGGGGFFAASRRVSCVCFVAAATASRGRPCRARGPSFLTFRAVSRRRVSAVSRGASTNVRRGRTTSGAGADSVMSVGFSSSAIFVQVLDSWELSMSAAAARRTAPLDRWELQLSQASACRNSEYLRA